MLHIELYFIQAYRETVPFQAFLIREILGKVQATLLQGHYLFLVNCCILAQQFRSDVLNIFLEQNIIAHR